MFKCLLFSVVSSTAVTRTTLPSFKFRRTYFATENQVIAAVFLYIILLIIITVTVIISSSAVMNESEAPTIESH